MTGYARATACASGVASGSSEGPTHVVHNTSPLASTNTHVSISASRPPPLLRKRRNTPTARTLRHAELSDQRTEANQVSERMARPLALLVFGLTLFVLVPFMLRMFGVT